MRSRNVDEAPTWQTVAQITVSGSAACIQTRLSKESPLVILRRLAIGTVSQHVVDGVINGVLNKLGAAIAHGEIRAARVRALESAREPVFGVVRARFHRVEWNLSGRHRKVIAEHAVPYPMGRQGLPHQEGLREAIGGKLELGANVAPAKHAETTVRIRRRIGETQRAA